jgi:putative transposase
MNTVNLTARERRQLRTALRQTRDAGLYRRLLAVLEFDRGATISEIAELLGVSYQSVCNWLVRFQGRGDATQLSDAPRSGRPARAGEVVDILLRMLLKLSPEWSGYHATHWTVPLLQDQLRQYTGEDYSSDTVRRSLHRLGYVWKRPRYILAPDPEREKKTPHSPRPVWLAPAQRGAG